MRDGNTENLFDWMNRKLSEILDFPVPQDLTQYILSIENARDLEDYLKTLLNFNNPQHGQFYSELLQKRQIALVSGKSDYQGYKKSEQEESYIPAKQTEKKKKSKNQTDDATQKENVNTKESHPSGQGKKKSKFVNLYSADGQAKDVIMLKGRHRCDCQANKHRLINNCIKCGRIVCEQEGSGPCLFCNNLVCSRDEQQLMNTGSKQGNQLYQKLIEQKGPEGWDSAIQHRNRLLEYDRTSERRTRVIDDESDYFTTNSVWLSKAEREKLKQQEEELRAKRHASRLDRKITLDFAGRRVLEDDQLENFYEPDESVLKEINQMLIEDDSIVDPGIMYSSPVFQDSVVPETLEKTSSAHWDDTVVHKRVQDREMLEMTDEGHCLSMHQPWASLLISGIKIHEGRTWYSSHRGRLWIAATVKVPCQEDIKQIEHVYQLLKGNEYVRFPSQYPTGCLLGCVTVVDVLPQEEYRSKFPDGESDSPFVFICEDPKALPVRFPIQGKHKIYKLDPKIHKAAQKSLQRLAKIEAERMAKNLS